ncbi:MAG TPA: HEPN domain-containing protein [Oscillospiraceae bacterium]|nr:HEPN domain-containing protein [Oscillospiraceae bacterium]
MKTADKYKYWLMLSQYDLDTARVLIDGERWVYVAYMCQQALERQIKGMYVYHIGKEAPKSHNLGFLFESVTSSPGFQSADSPFSEERKEACEDFLTEVMFFYMSDYPFSYKKIANRFIDAATASELYRRTRETIAFLRSLQPIPETFAVEDLIRD